VGGGNKPHNVDSEKGKWVCLKRGNTTIDAQINADSRM